MSEKAAFFKAELIKKLDSELKVMLLIFYKLPLALASGQFEIEKRL